MAHYNQLHKSNQGHVEIMKIRIFTPVGIIECNLQDTNIEKYKINEYCEEIMEDNR